MSRALSERTGKFPVKTSVATLNGTSYVELVPSPPSGEVYRISSLFGGNSSGGTRTISIWFNDNGTRTSCYLLGAFNGQPFFQNSSSPNDREMLIAADIPVVVKNRHASSLTVNSERTIYTRQEGPSGWQEAIDGLLETVIQ